MIAWSWDYRCQITERWILVPGHSPLKLADGLDRPCIDSPLGPLPSHHSAGIEIYCLSVFTPDNFALDQEEMRPASSCAPHRRTKSRKTARRNRKAPSGPVVREKAQVDSGFAPTRTNHRNAPGIRMADGIERILLEVLRYILYLTNPEKLPSAIPYNMDEARPDSLNKTLHDSSGFSSNGSTSPRPT